VVDVYDVVYVVGSYSLVVVEVVVVVVEVVVVVDVVVLVVVSVVVVRLVVVVVVISGQLGSSSTSHLQPVNIRIGPNSI